MSIPTSILYSGSMRNSVFVFSVESDSGHNFMLKLLMESLLKNDGMEEMLEGSIEVIITKRLQQGVDETVEDLASQTLAALLCQLFSSHTSQVIQTLTTKKKVKDEYFHTILAMLLKYQRILFARVFQVSQKDKCWPAKCEYYLFSKISQK